MSADELKRAATKLREHAGRLPEPWASRPWRTVQTDTESIDGIAACENEHADDPTGSPDCCWSSESVGHPAVASLAVLMHPPVALALADWLDAIVADADLGINESQPGAYAVARAVLREEATS